MLGLEIAASGGGPPQAGAAAATERDRTILDQGGRRTILLVEDDVAASYALARAVEEAGYAVITAPDYRKALSELDSGRRIDLLITDIGLPKGTPHGFALGRMARMRQAGLKVMYLTGVIDLPEDEVRTALGPILRKPIDPDVLILEISRALGSA